MKRRLLFIVILAFTLAGGIGIWRVFNHAYPQFQYLTCYQPYSDAWEFEFESPDGKHYPSDCPGCSGMSEPGNVSFFVDYTSTERTAYLFDSQLAGELIEQGDKLDENGVKIGKRVVILTGDLEDMPGAEIFWREGDVFWSIHAPTVELAEGFEHSYAFGMARSEIPIPSK